MSKNIIIQEGGVAKQLTVDKLKTEVMSGGTMLWVPEEDVQLTTKYITEDGTYNASEDGYYGYSQVTVSGIGTATGIGPDGNEHTVSPDPETGNLVDEVIPSSIVVTTPPTMTSYIDGESIDITGIVVTAYKKDGTIWSDSTHPGGVIPVSELSFNPTIAAFDAESAIINLDGNGIHMLGYVGKPQYRYSSWLLVYKGVYGLPYVPSVGDEYPDIVYPVVGAGTQDTDVILYLTEYNGSIYAASSKQVGVGVMPNANISGSFTSYTRIGEKSFGGLGSEEILQTLISMAGSSTTDPEGVFYNTLEETGLHSEQTITVSWIRPGDGATLETTFTINVTPATT